MAARLRYVEEVISELRGSFQSRIPETLQEISKKTTMTEPPKEAAYIEKFYEYSEQLNNAKDKSRNMKDCDVFMFSKNTFCERIIW